jgi:hypothetical protein
VGITRKALRNGLLLLAAALSASIEAPRLAHSSLNVHTAGLGASNLITDAIERVEDNVSNSHLGFDTNIYPGDRTMDAWKKSGDYEWVGYYLEAPCHKDGSWTGTRARLTTSGWGLAVIYVGQQTWGKFSPRPAVKAKRPTLKRAKSKTSRAHTMTRKSTKPIASTGTTCSAAFVNAARGRTDAADAIAKAEAEGFTLGSVVFLDVEYMTSVPQPMRDYYRAWTQAMLADGRYRPGIYAHTRNAATVFDDVSELYSQVGARGDPPFWIAGSGGFAPGLEPTRVGHAFASAWQGLLDVVREQSGIRLPIDISVSKVASPSSVTR